MTFTCVSDEAEPPPSLVWTFCGEKLLNVINTMISAGYHSHIVESKATLVAESKCDNEEVRCSIYYQQPITAAVVLDISSKFGQISFSTLVFILYNYKTIFNSLALNEFIYKTFKLK